MTNHRSKDGGVEGRSYAGAKTLTESFKGAKNLKRLDLATQPLGAFENKGLATCPKVSHESGGHARTGVSGVDLNRWEQSLGGSSPSPSVLDLQPVTKPALYAQRRREAGFGHKIGHIAPTRSLRSATAVV